MSRDGPVPLSSRKARALLGLLATSASMTLPREKICGLLWSETEEEKARASLRQCLKGLRDETPPGLAEIILADRELVGLDRHRVDCDITDLLDKAERHDFADPAFARTELHESLFEGLHDLDESLSASIAVFRETVRRRLSAAFSAAMRQDGDEGLREPAAVAMLALDPAHEPAARMAMSARVAAGDRAGALKLFEDFRQRLREDYDASPEPETIALYKAIRQRASAPATGTNSDTGDDHLTILVADDDQSGRATGFALFVATFRGMLARFRNWTILSGASGSPVGAIDYTLGLKARPSGSGLQVIVDLIEARTGATVWSRALAMDLADAIAGQETLLRGLCGALNVYISENQISRLRIREPQSLSALEKWLKGQNLLQLWQPEADSRAEQLFLEAVHAWPDHATLHANLADIYNVRHIVFPGVLRDAEHERKAMRFARQAVALEAAARDLAAAIVRNIDKLAKDRASFSVETPVNLNAGESDEMDARLGDVTSQFDTSGIVGTAIAQALAADPAVKLTPPDVVARVGALTCAGCHQFIDGRALGEGAAGSVQTWPAKGLPFVHVSEADPREDCEGMTDACFATSTTLKELFLPSRTRLLQDILAKTLF